MPFPPQKPKRFDRPSVEQLPSGAVGCYGLFRRDRWVYIGKGNIRDRLLAHLDGDSPAILDQQPTHWVAVEAADYEKLLRDLILACEPVCSEPDPVARGAVRRSR